MGVRLSSAMGVPVSSVTVGVPVRMAIGVWPVMRVGVLDPAVAVALASQRLIAEEPLISH